MGEESGRRNDSHRHETTSASDASKNLDNLTPWESFPTAGYSDVSQEQFLVALQAAVRRDEQREPWYVRIAAIPTSGGVLHPFLTVLGREPTGNLLGETDCDLRLGSACLISRPLTSTDLQSLETLRRVLSIDTTNPTAGLPHGNVFPTQRHPSHVARNGSHDDPPSWVSQWEFSRGNNPSLPQDRLFNADYGIFFQGIAQAAAAWSGEFDLYQKNHTAPLYRIRIPDDRAWFSEVVTEDGGVKVTTRVERPLQLYCATHLQTADGFEQTIVTEISGPTSIRFPVTPAVLSLHLFDERGREYDWLERRSYKSRTGVSLFDWHFELLSRANSDLISARDRGEGDTIEFKPGIKPTRKGNSDKLAELLETVAAFANAAGGSIFIGVDDNGRVTGANAELASYAAAAKGDVQVQRELYATYLKGIIAEGVQPTISVDMSWTDYSGLSVLRLAVPRGHERPYVLAENDAIYVRRGATNRAATRADVLDLGRQRGHFGLGLR